MTGQIYRFSVGTVGCLVVQDNDSTLTEERMLSMFPKAPQDDLLNEMRQLPASSSMNCLIIETDGERVLVDTGLGSAAPLGTSCLLDGLSNAGIAPADITIVLITHCHPDHVGGILDTEDKLVFPNARYILNKDEWDYWSNDTVLEQMGERGAMLRKRFAAIKDKLTLTEPEAEIVPGVYAVAAYGHTPGQIGVRIESQGDGLLALADAIRALVQMQHPDWSPGFDMQPDISPVTRRALCERAADSGIKTMLYHFPFPGIGHVIREGDAFAWKPV